MQVVVANSQVGAKGRVDSKPLPTILTDSKSSGHVDMSSRLLLALNVFEYSPRRFYP
ncbi:hypothetical protein DEBA109399_10675 [Dermacoccus barathri]